MNPTKTMTTISAATLIAIGGFTLAGPLNPPAGSVTSTMKTMTEVEPRIAINVTNTPGDNDATPSLFKITQPGSYYLTGNITGVANKYGIEIDANGVTIDLNGFALQGVSGSRSGIFMNSFRYDATVRNGTVSGWGGEGLYLSGAPVGSCSVINVKARANGTGGIKVGINSIVDRCTVRSNAGPGIQTLQGSIITHCTATENEQGIWAGGYYCVISDCTATDNTDDGIVTPGGAVIKNCTSSSNLGDGIYAANESTITNNVCNSNGEGAASGAGIRAAGLNVRIEGNNCVGNDYNIRVDGTRCVVIRNSCSDAGTSDYFLVAGNVYGPIVDRRSPASPAVAGYSAPSTLGSTDPNANFSY